MYLNPDQFCLCLQDHRTRIAVFLSICRSECAAPRDLCSLQAHGKTLQLSGHGAEVFSGSHHGSAASPKGEGFPFTSVISHRDAALPQSLHTLASWGTRSVYYFTLMLSTIKFPLGAGTEPCSRNRQCDPLCSQLFFRHSPVQALCTPTLFVPRCLCCADSMWFFSFPGDSSPNGVDRRNRCAPLSSSSWYSRGSHLLQKVKMTTAGSNFLNPLP